MNYADSFFSSLCKYMNKYFPTYINISEEQIDFKLSNESPIHFFTSKKGLGYVFSYLEEDHKEDTTSYCVDDRYESLIRFDVRRANSRILANIYNDIIDVEKKDTINNYVYKISHASERLLLLVYKNIGDNRKEILIEELVKSFAFNDIFKADDVQVDMSKYPRNSMLLDFMLSSFNDILTLKIEGNYPHSIEKFTSLCDAFIFHFSYNMGMPLIRQLHLDDLLIDEFDTTGKISYEKLDTPKRIYDSDLVSHYETAISTINPHLQFLAFYHIVEYFYEDVYSKHLFNLVETKITDPSFCYSNPENIYELIGIMQSNIKKRNSENDYNELDTLVLVLAEYVDMNELVNRIKKYDSELIEHYKKPVQFLNKYGIDFSSEKTLIKNIASRIYNVRNSVVHSKKGNFSVCMPFRHDYYLSKEIPLIKLIAESIIIRKSNLIENPYDIM